MAQVAPAKLSVDKEELRELVSALVEEKVRSLPIWTWYQVEDMEKLRRSPLGTLIRLEEKIDRVEKELVELRSVMVTKDELRDELAELRATMVTKEELAELRSVMVTRDEWREMRATMVTREELEARFEALERRFIELKEYVDRRMHQTDLRINATLGILSTLMIAILLKLFLG